MSRKRKTIEKTAGGLLLLFLLFALNLIKDLFILPMPDTLPCRNKIFIQLSGDTPHPGVYEFCNPPDQKKLMTRAVGKDYLKRYPLLLHKGPYKSGTRLDIRTHENTIEIIEGEMSAFYKITFEIPISLNRETFEGLTAVPGIGPKLAATIVKERAKRGGFKSLDELLSIPRIGDSRYKKLVHYLIL